METMADLLEHYSIGRIQNVVKDKNFGFIATDDGKTIFFHGSGVHGDKIEDLEVGSMVQFKTVDTKKGLKAFSVIVAKS
jgi:CspA family cold shock protein